MPVLHIIASGPPGSGKSTLVRHLSNNPPEGYKIKRSNAIGTEAPNTEYWCLVFEKIRQRKKEIK